MAQTEFKDKTGKPIYTGDIIQWRLSKFAKKNDGPAFYQVYASKKRGVMVRFSKDSVGRPLREHDCQYIVVVDTSERES